VQKRGCQPPIKSNQVSKRTLNAGNRKDTNHAAGEKGENPLKKGRQKRGGHGLKESRRKKWKSYEKKKREVRGGIGYPDTERNANYLMGKKKKVYQKNWACGE